MQKTKIGWTDFTWNIISGCYKRCDFCYAWKLAKGRLKNLYIKGPNQILNGADPNDPFTPRFWPNRLKEPYQLKKPERIFVCSMGEMFGHWIPVNWRFRIWEVIKDNPQHAFQILTKFPQNIFFDLGSRKNCWMGVTVTSQQNVHRLDELYKNTFALSASLCPIRFVSFEPLLSKIKVDLRGFNWIILGAQTQPYRPPRKEWVEEIIEKADRHKIPIFIKNNLKPLLGENLRQEFPKGA